MGRHSRISAVAVGTLVIAGTILLPLASATAGTRPAVSGVSPMAGPTAGAVRVTIVGSRFKHVKSVHFGKVAATRIRVLSAHKLTVIAPAHAAGVVDIRVRTAAGTSPIKAADHYTYAAPPRITAVSPTSGPTAGGMQVTVRGANFSRVKSVEFGTAAASHISVASRSKLTVTVPTHNARRVDVRVVTAYGTSRAVSADHYTYVGPPAVHAVSANSGTTAGGTVIKITGTNFLKVSAVTVGGVAGTALAVSSPTSLQVTTPARAAGSVDVRVTTSYGTSATGAADHFTYIDIALTNETAVALANRMFGNGAVDTVPVPPDCDGSMPFACPGGVPSDPPPNVSIDKALHAGDDARAAGTYPGSSQFDITGRFRLKTLQTIPITVPLTGECGLDIDTTPGASPDIQVTVPVSVVIDPNAGSTADGPTAVGDIAIDRFDSSDYVVSGGPACELSNVSVSAVLTIVNKILTPWVTSLGTVCGAPAPDLVQSCPSG